MFGELATCYLFFGGVGAGALFVASLVDLLFLREPFGGSSALSSLESNDARRRTLAGCFIAGFVLVVLGCACLLFDVGRIDRVISLFLNPSLTYLTVGSYALAVLAVLGGFHAAVRALAIPAVSRTAVSVAEVVTAAVSVAVMAYTGLLLSGMGTIPLWDTPLVPALFVLSSLSAGCAVFMCAAYFSRTDGAGAAFPDAVRDMQRTARLVSACDIVLIVLETMCAFSFAFWSLRDSRAGASAADLLFAGGLPTALWWVVFVCFGLAVPLVLECLFRVRSLRLPAGNLQAACCLAGALVLAGAFGLRVSLVDAGSHRPLELENPAGVMSLTTGDVEGEGSVQTRG